MVQDGSDIRVRIDSELGFRLSRIRWIRNRSFLEIGDVWLIIVEHDACLGVPGMGELRFGAQLCDLAVELKMGPQFCRSVA